MKVLNSFHLLAILCHQVAANTEIINFSSSREPTVDLPLGLVGNWSTLHPTDNERRWSLEPAALHTPLHQVCERTPFSCPHELWLLLDLDDEKWASYSTFTLRLSWPASTPADFAMVLYTPQDLADRLSERGLISSSPSSPRRTLTTRSRYARLRAVHAGIPTPHPPSPGSDTSPRTTGTVPFIMILEPTYWGVLPATLFPTVGFLIPIVLTAVSFVPWATAYLDPFVRQARQDLKTGVTRANEERKR